MLAHTTLRRILERLTQQQFKHPYNSFLAPARLRRTHEAPHSQNSISTNEYGSRQIFTAAAYRASAFATAGKATAEPS